MSMEPASPAPDPVEEAIFHAASELHDPQSRSAFLDRACGADSALRARIETLLAADARASRFLGEDPLEMDSGSGPLKTVITPTLQSGSDQIGRYKLLQKIGEGGMGVVYMAEQREPVIRKVAIKIIKPGMDTRQVVARFEAERQALAMMDHPNIARVLDGGVTDTGRPYFVMDLVQGLPITQFCDERKFSTRARLDLFLEVCSAIQHAHQKGIIHRDLKPTNILVTLHGDKPVPKVIDFGIAKATQQRLTDKTLFTQFQHFIGTPAYMSPEQANLSGLDIDTRSDIYGLGVLLYELLIGKTPFDGNDLLKVGLEEMRRTILEKEPPRPSTRLQALHRDELTTTAKRRLTEAPKLIHQLRGDLDWIVMKCLEKDRNRRYETANGLATDIKRHLGNEPVIARPPSAVYRFQKLVRRNKLQFGAATFALSALLIGLGVSTWQAVRATRAERDARAVKDFLVEQLLAANPYMQGVSDSNWRGLLKRVERAVESRFANQPLMEAELRMALAEASYGLEDHFNITAQFEKALQIRRRALGLKHSDTLWTIACTAQSYDYLGRLRDAQKMLAEPLALIEARPHALSVGEAEILYTHGSLLRKAGLPVEALSYQEKAMAVAKQYADPKSFRFQNKIVGLSYTMLQAGRTNEADASFAEGLQQAERHFGADHPMTAEFHKGRAIRLYGMGRFEEAAMVREHTVPIYHRSLGTNHRCSLDAEFGAAHAYEELGRTPETARRYADLYPRIIKHLLPHPLARYELHIIGSFFARQGRFDEARAVLGPLRESYDANPPELPVDVDRLIDATAATKGWPAAAEICRANLDRFPTNPVDLRTNATLLLYAGDAEGYRQVVAKAFALAPTLKRWWEQQNILNIAVLGTDAFSPEQIRQCEAFIESGKQALASATESQRSSGHRVLGAMLLRLGRLTNSLEHLDQAAQKYPPGINRARVLVLKAMAAHGLGRIEEARNAFDEAEAMMKSALLDRLNESEGFLAQDERTYLIHRREAQALLDATAPKL
jgi:eukaryotic-like serine/threonine-protein kinase